MRRAGRGDSCASGPKHDVMSDASFHIMPNASNQNNKAVVLVLKDEHGTGYDTSHVMCRQCIDRNSFQRAPGQWNVGLRCQKTRKRTHGCGDMF